MLLAAAAPGHRGRVLRVSDRDASILRALVEVGVEVGRTVEVTDAGTVAVDGASPVALPRRRGRRRLAQRLTSADARRVHRGCAYALHRGRWTPSPHAAGPSAPAHLRGLLERPGHAGRVLADLPDALGDLGAAHDPRGLHDARRSARAEPRSDERAALDRASASARTSGQAPCSLDCVKAACRLSTNRVVRDGSLTPRIPWSARWSSSPDGRRRSRPAPPPRAAAGRPRTRARSSRPWTARTRATACTRRELRIDGVVRTDRRRHASEPDKTTGCRSQRRQQLAGERVMTERIRREDELVAVLGLLALLGRMDDPGVEKHPVERPAHSGGRRGGAHRAEVARVEEQGLDRGIRIPSHDRGACDGEPVRAAPRHDDVRTGAGELLDREEAEAGVGPRHEVRAPMEVGQLPGVPLCARHTSTLRPRTPG